MSEIAILQAQKGDCERKTGLREKLDTVSETAGFTASENVVRNKFGRPDRTSAAGSKSSGPDRPEFLIRILTRFSALRVQKKRLFFRTGISGLEACLLCIECALYSQRLQAVPAASLARTRPATRALARWW